MFFAQAIIATLVYWIIKQVGKIPVIFYTSLIMQKLDGIYQNN